MPSASDEWSRRFEGIWRSCYCLQRSIVALRVTKPPTKHVTDGVGNIISAPAVTFFVGCHTWHLRATETQRAQHFSPRNCWRSAALPGRSGEVVRKLNGNQHVTVLGNTEPLENTFQHCFLSRHTQVRPFQESG